MKVYKTIYGTGDVQLSFVIGEGKPYIYTRICTTTLHLSGGQWGRTLASDEAQESSWLEVLILTGKSHVEIEKAIKELNESRWGHEIDLGEWI